MITILLCQNAEVVLSTLSHTVFLNNPVIIPGQFLTVGIRLTTDKIKT